MSVTVSAKRKSPVPSVVVAGLQSAGKSAIIHTFLSNLMPVSSAPSPTLVPSTHTLRPRALKRALKVVDLQGAEGVMRRLDWCMHAARASVLVYVVDASNAGKLSESMRELHALYKNSAAEAPKPSMPLVILCNKAEVETAVSVEKIAKVLDLENLPVARSVLVPCSAKTGMNMKAALACILSEIPPKK